jgi:hypothetical protein
LPVFVVAGPEDVDPAFRFIKKICNVRTVDGVDGYAFAPGYVAYDGFASDRVTTFRAIDEKIAGAADYDGVGVGSVAA